MAQQHQDCLALEQQLLSCQNNAQAVLDLLSAIRSAIDNANSALMDVRKVFRYANNDDSKASADVSTSNGAVGRLDSAAELESIRKVCWSWLLSVIQRPPQGDDGDAVLDQATAIISDLSGRTASGAVVKSWQFDSFSLQVGEASLAEAYLGCQTWGSGVLLAHLFSSGAVDTGSMGRCVLELGSGTGMGGLALCKRLLQHGQDAQVYLTDYHRGVLSTLDRNLARNDIPLSAALYFDPDSRSFVPAHFNSTTSDSKVPSVFTAELDWNWFLDKSTPPFSTDTSPPAAAATPLTVPNQFTTILAADVIYDTGNAHQIPAVIANYLCRPAQSGSEQHQPTSWIVLPLRERYDSDIALFEEQMEKHFECAARTDYIAGESARYRLYKYHWRRS
ncbi:Protein-lysine N-methyltransferase rrg1 [Sorochytrium milnesiophthora]